MAYDGESLKPVQVETGFEAVSEPRHQMFLSVGKGSKAIVWVLGTLGCSQQASCQSSLDAVSGQYGLYALGFAILWTAAKATLARAKFYLRKRWYRI